MFTLTELSKRIRQQLQRDFLFMVSMILLGISPELAWSQINYVKNHSFEDGIPNTLPLRTSSFSACKPWIDLRESPDWFRDHNNSSSACYNDCYAGSSSQPDGSANVPYNVLGFQNAYQGGRAYAGIWGARWSVINGLVDHQVTRPIFELITQKLDYTLVAGETYTVSFRISRAEASNIALKNIGLYFATSTPLNGSFNLSSLIPGAIPTTWVTNKTDWVLVESSYKAVGGEQWIVLGDPSATLIGDLNPLQLQHGVHWTATEPGENTCKLQCPLLSGPDQHGCVKDLRSTPSEDGCRIAYYYFDDIQVMGPECNCSPNLKALYVPKYIAPHSNNPQNCCFSVYVYNGNTCPESHADALNISVNTSEQYSNPSENPFVSSASGGFNPDPSYIDLNSYNAGITYVNPNEGNGTQTYAPGSTTYIGDFCVKMPATGQLIVSSTFYDKIGEGEGRIGCNYNQQISCSIEPCCDFIKPHFNRVDPCNNPFKHEIVFDLDMPNGMLPCNFAFTRIRRANSSQSLVPISSNTNWTLAQSSASELKYSYSGIVQPNGTYSVGIFNINKSATSYVNEPLVLDLLDANGKLICSKVLWLDCFTGDEFDCTGRVGASKSATDQEIVSTTDSQLPETLSIDPNPANTGEVNIGFELAEAAQIRLELYDVSGTLVRVLANGERAKGMINTQCKTDDLPTGTYYVKLIYNNRVISAPLQIVH